ncbi:MAG: ribosome silencing factor [Arenimonas sp.]
MKTSPLVTLVEKAIEDIKGLDLKFIDVRDLTTITDYMVICTGTSNRHAKSIADNVIARAKAAGYRPLGVEGLDTGEWVLVDLGDVVAHVMQAQTRAFYQLEKLWDVPPPAPAPTARAPKAPKPGKPKKGRKATARPRRGGKTRTRR